MLPALFQLNAGLEPEPELVADWPTPKDFGAAPFSVTLRLREAAWSDGKAITSKDVAFSFAQLRRSHNGSRYRFLTDVEELTPRSFKLVFDRPIRRWWSLFSIDDMVLPEHAFSDEWDRAGPNVSGGPFKVGDWEDGLRVRLVRNDAYWGEKANAGGIDVYFVADDETRLQLMQRDEMDAMFAEGDVNIGRRAEAYGFGNAVGTWGPAWWELDLDPKRLPGGAARAILEMTDPDLIAEVLEDSGRPIGVIEADFADDRQLVTKPWNGRGSVTEARAHLRSEAPDEFQIAYARNGTAGAFARIIHFRLLELGIRAELVGLESDVFDRSWLATKNAPALLYLRRGADAPDVTAYGVDADVDAAESIDPKNTEVGLTGIRPGAWLRKQRSLRATAEVAPLAFVRSWLVGTDRVSGLSPSGAANGPLWNAGAWGIEG